MPGDFATALYAIPPLSFNSRMIHDMIFSRETSVVFSVTTFQRRKVDYLWSNISHIAHQNMRQEQTVYEQYLHTQELLALQTPEDKLVHHDELQFQVVHQVFELWWKETDFELHQYPHLVATVQHPTCIAPVAARHPHPISDARQRAHAGNDDAVGFPRLPQSAGRRCRYRFARLSQSYDDLTRSCGTILSAFSHTNRSH